MTIERERPLPVGRYWIDVFASRRVAWEAWRNFAVPTYAVVEHTESFPSTGDNESREFVIFRVLTPVVWPDSEMRIGVNVAPNTIRSSSDTVQRPESEPAAIDSFLAGLRQSLSTIAAVGVGIGLIGVLVVVTRKKR